MPRVRLYKMIPVVLRSWVAFLFAIVILAAFWYGCYWAIARWAPGALGYFRIGAIGAGVVGGLMIIFNERLVVLCTGAQRIRQFDECPALWQAVERATPLYARPLPRIYLVPSSGCNAFAFGWGLPYCSAVAATYGITKELEPDELTAVMAHEVGHIINKDILISMVLTISVMLMAFTGWLLLRLGPYSSSERRSSDNKGGSSAVALLVILAVGFALYGVGRLLGTVLQLFVSRQREYAADALAAQQVGRAQPLISALHRIQLNASLGSSRSTNAAIGFLCTADPDPDDLISPPPSFNNRIAALQSLES